MKTKSKSEGPKVRLGFSVSMSPAFIAIVAGVIIYKQLKKRSR